jgi:hypothetical protein
LAPGQRSRTVGEVLGAQQLAADGPGEHLLGACRTAGEEAGEDGGGGYASDGTGLGGRSHAGRDWNEERRVKLISG